MSAWDEFLNPQSMITPGVAGGLTMFITNGVCVNFGELTPRWVALGLSFMLGLVVWRYTAPLTHRAVYYLVNSLIIFVMATGSNALGGGIAKAISTDARAAAVAYQASSTRLAGLDANTAVISMRSATATSPMRVAQQQEEKPKPVERPRTFFETWF